MKKSALSAMLCVALSGGVMAQEPVSSQPNVVIFYVDDLGWGDLGSYGHTIVQTPHIDQLAHDGIQYQQFYSPAPLCSPSRAGLLTGRTPYRTGIRSWIPPKQDVHLGENEITLAHLLQGEGYDTAIMGKVHLNGGIDMKDHPQTDDMGFDYSFILPGGWVKNGKVETVQADGSPRVGKMYPDNFWRNGEPVGETNKFSAELVTDEVLSWLDNRDKENPFFLYIPYSEVHTPIASPDKYLDMYSEHITEFARKNPDIYHWDWHDLPYRGPGEYYANISFLDAQLGRVMTHLEEMGVEDNTIVIFSSDNGPVTREARKPWELNMAGETGGLRGRKDNLLEGGIRVPGIIKYPQLIEGKQVSQTPVYSLDVLPTLAELVGFDVPNDRVIDGQSIVGTFDGGEVDRERPMIWTIDMQGQDDEVNEWAIRDGDWKLIVDRQGEAKYLFNIENDMYEVYNLLNSEPKKLAEMMALYQAYRSDIESDAIMKQRNQ